MRLRRRRLSLFMLYALLAGLLMWVGQQGVSRYYAHLLQQQLHAYVATQQERLTWMMQAQLKNLQDELLLAAFTFSRLPDVPAILRGQRNGSETIRQILSAWSSRSNYATLWVQIISADGVSHYRSWTTQRGDSLLKVRPDLRQVLASPAPVTTLSIGRYALTAKAIVPVYEGDDLLGVLEVISDLRPLIRALRRENFLAAVLVEARFASQLDQAGQLTRIGNWLLLQSVDDPALFEYLRHVDLDHLAQTGVLVDFERDLGWWWVPIRTTSQGEVGALVTTQALSRHKQELVALFQREQALWRGVIALLALVVPALIVMAVVLYREHGQLSHAFNAGIAWRMLLRDGVAVRINRRLREAVEAAGIDTDAFMRSPLSYLVIIRADDPQASAADTLAWLEAHPDTPQPVQLYLDSGPPRLFIAILTPMDSRGGWLLTLMEREQLCQMQSHTDPVEPGRADDEG